MPIQSEIVGLNGRQLSVNEEGAIHAVIHQHPPTSEDINAFPFRSYFQDSAGSNDMVVNGSTNAVDFFIAASPDFDIYIKYITAEISDTTNLKLNNFGGLSPLTNGVAFLWDTQAEPSYELHEGIKTNKEFIRIASDTAAVGTGTDAFLADVSGGGTQKSYFPNLDMTEIYGFQWGIRLRKGTLDKLIFRVRDNLTGLSVFNIIATGTRL